LTRALVRFVGLPASEQRNVVEAALSLLVVRLAFGLLPFPRALRLFCIVQGEARGGKVAESKAVQVSYAIARAARYVPFRAACLQQAFAALLMLRRRGLAATVHLGLAHKVGADALEAHAWSHCGAVPVTGVETAQDFVPIAAFA
jgi:Transglutaminase-like superfamily